MAGAGLRQQPSQSQSMRPGRRTDEQRFILLASLTPSEVQMKIPPSVNEQTPR